MVVAEKGDMFLYTFQDNGGRLAIDGTHGNYSDFVTDQNDTLLGKLNSSYNFRFNVYISTGPIEKTLSTSYQKYYSLPANYVVKAWLNNVGPNTMNVQVLDGEIRFFLISFYKCNKKLKFKWIKNQRPIL